MREKCPNTEFIIWTRSKLVTTYQVLNFVFKIKSKKAPSAFQTHFTEVRHPYPTRFSEDSFVESQIALTQSKFNVSRSTFVEQTTKLAMKGYRM